MSALGAPALGAIRRIADRPPRLRCVGCGSPARELGPEIEFLSFGAACYRGVIVDSAGGGAVRERLDEINLCALCIAQAFFLSPERARAARERVSEERRACGEEIANVQTMYAETQAEIVKAERALKEITQERQRVEELQAGVAEWTRSYDLALEAHRETRLQAWALERAQIWDSSEDAAAELADARELSRKARAALRALTRAGERLAARCQDKNLAAENALVNSRLTAGDSDDDG